METMLRFNSETITDRDVRELENLAQRLSQDSSLVPIINLLLHAKTDGSALRMLHEERELSPNEAAEIIGMSRPFLLKFIRAGELKVRKVGTHQKIALSDLLEFQQRRDKAQRFVEEALARPAEAVSVEFTSEDIDLLDEV